MFLESVADQHEGRLTEDKKKSAEVNPYQLREGKDVYLDKKNKSALAQGSIDDHWQKTLSQTCLVPPILAKLFPLRQNPRRKARTWMQHVTPQILQALVTHFVHN